MQRRSGVRYPRPLDLAWGLGADTSSVGETSLMRVPVA